MKFEYPEFADSISSLLVWFDEQMYEVEGRYYVQGRPPTAKYKEVGQYEKYYKYGDVFIQTSYKKKSKKFKELVEEELGEYDNNKIYKIDKPDVEEKILTILKTRQSQYGRFFPQLRRIKNNNKLTMSDLKTLLWGCMNEHSVYSPAYIQYKVSQLPRYKELLKNYKEMKENQEEVEVEYSTDHIEEEEENFFEGL